MRQNHMRSTEPEKINNFLIFDISKSDQKSTFSLQYPYIIKQTGDENKGNSQIEDSVSIVSVFHGIVLSITIH